jgi:hypothetical protein
MERGYLDEGSGLIRMRQYQPLSVLIDALERH